MLSISTICIVTIVLVAALFTLSLYFSLSYIEYLKENDKRLIKQTRIGAVVSLFIAVLLCLFFLISSMKL